MSMTTLQVKDATSAIKEMLVTEDVDGVLTPHHIVDSMGWGALTNDAWGVPKVSLPKSLFHGMWTFDVPKSLWFMYENGAEVATSTRIVSDAGALKMAADVTKSALVLEGRECPRYQPNRGVLFSTALWCPDPTADGTREWGVGTDENRVNFRLNPDGNLYAVMRSGGYETAEEEIDTSGVAGFDVSKGNVYDIQYQWRGVGNYVFYVNLVEVHRFENLGTLTALSVENPAMPVRFAVTRTSEDLEMHVGCADISSENGDDDREQPLTAWAESAGANGTDIPVLVVHNPLQTAGVTNTRTVVLRELSVFCDKKGVVKIWKTRSAGDITGETLKTVSGSLVECDSTDMDGTAVQATALTTANCELLDAFPVQANIEKTRVLSMPRLLLTMVRGDHIVVTVTATAGTVDAVLKMGQEI